ncbi:MAG: glutamate racemase [Proteobacteria bacterium]|nr:glutamate racemase [Pseudomonadota bacterium]
MPSRSASTALPVDSIGVFDSGVGGLSVLQALRRAQPQACLHYVADSAFAPYGERCDKEIRDRSRRIVEHLLAQGARLIVVACNTATAAAIDTLRREHPGTPFVGVEPGVRPAIALSRRKRIAVMATEATLRSERFRALVQREAAGGFVHLQPCPGLAAAIEREDADSPALQALVTCYAAAVRAADVDVVALGCTHYPFVRHDIARVLGNEKVMLLDTADAVAAQAARLWRAPAIEADAAACRLQTTGDAQQLRRFAARWLDMAAVVAPSALEL